MVDSHLPRFAQAVQAVVLAVAFVVGWTVVVPVLAVVLAASVVGGPRWNLWAYAYRALPIPPGELEPAAPPRFSQLLGAAFLGIGTIGLFATTPESLVWWIVGWGPALAVAILSAIAATTAF